MHDARPHPGQRAVAEVMRRLLAGDAAAARIQDPYGYRAFPQVHGPAVDAARQAEQTITVDLNAAVENPLIDVAGPAAWHNGNFHTAYIGLALDAARAALFQTAALSAARLGTLVEPAFTGLAPFQATDPPPSSGIMMLEYVSQAAIADIRQAGRARRAGQRRAVPRAWRNTPGSPPSRRAPPPTSCGRTGSCWPASWSPPCGRCG